MNSIATIEPRETSAEARSGAAVGLHAVVRSARLADGSIIPLLKDCACQTHEGPHWLHMDNIDRSLNRSLMDGATSSEQIRAYVEAEQRRLKEKLREMKARNIVEIL